MPDEVLTLPEVAQLLKVADRTVYTMAQRGEIPPSKCAGNGALSSWISINGLRDRKPLNSRKEPAQDLRFLKSGSGRARAVMITDYHAKYFAHELTKRCAPDPDPGTRSGTGLWTAGNARAKDRSRQAETRTGRGSVHGSLSWPRRARHQGPFQGLLWLTNMV